MMSGPAARANVGIRKQILGQHDTKWLYGSNISGIHIMGSAPDLESLIVFVTETLRLDFIAYHDLV
jgi:hypothetical protein